MAKLKWTKKQQQQWWLSKKRKIIEFPLDFLHQHQKCPSSLIEFGYFIVWKEQTFYKIIIKQLNCKVSQSMKLFRNLFVAVVIFAFVLFSFFFVFSNIVIVYGKNGPCIPQCKLSLWTATEYDCFNFPRENISRKLCFSFFRCNFSQLIIKKNTHTQFQAGWNETENVFYSANFPKMLANYCNFWP